MVIWLIGMSGSGKTTLGRAVAARLRKAAPNTVLLDGDEVREAFAADRRQSDYSVEAREVNARRMTALCSLLDRQGIHVVCCILSIFPRMRAENRTRFGSYYEVFLDAPLEVLEERDTKGLYAAARRGETGQVVGVDIPFPRPERPDLVIDTSTPPDDIDRLAREVLARAGLEP